MTNLNKNYITSVLKLPETSTIVILNGAYQSELSDIHPTFAPNNQTLTILKNSLIEAPIHLLFLTSKDCQTSFNIIAEEHSQATIIEEHLSLGNDNYTNSINTTVIAENGSNITIYKLQNENINLINHQNKTSIHQAQNSKISSFLISAGAKTALETLHIQLIGKNGSYSVQGINLLRDTQTNSHHILIEHLAPNCSSNVLFKGIIDEQATSNFDCRVIVHPGALKTETHVTNKNLLLAETATANTSPELEVYVDDVICTHGATVGQLDQDAIFYLRSRGIEKTLAIKLLTSAFVKEITEQFSKFERLKTATELTYE